MKTRLALLFLCTAALVLSAASTAAIAAHPPRSEAEIALSKILKAADADDEILDNLFHRYPASPVPAAKRVDYGRFLTRAFFAALKEQQKKLVQSDCGGVYREGDICGMDYNPLTCAQDTVGAVSLSTVTSTAGRAVIADARTDRYTMAHEQDGWKLDGVDCSTK